MEFSLVDRIDPNYIIIEEAFITESMGYVVVKCKDSETFITRYFEIKEGTEELICCWGHFFDNADDAITDMWLRVGEKSKEVECFYIGGDYDPAPIAACRVGQSGTVSKADRAKRSLRLRRCWACRRSR